MSGNYQGLHVTRPGALTAIAVFSILIASVSLLVDFGDLFFASIVSQFAGRTMPAPVAAAPLPAPAAAGTEYVAADGLSASQRQIVIEALGQARPITEIREKQLDGLLADVGRKVIGISPEYLTTDRVVAYVTSVQSIPNGSGGPADDMFILGSGRLQLSDESAVFFPGDSPSPIRSGGGSYTDSSGQTHLASTQIAAVVDRVRALHPEGIADVQATALEAELESSSQTLITPSASVAEAAGQVQSVQSFDDGTIGIVTINGAISLGPNGQTSPGLAAMGATQGPWGGRPTVARRDSTLLVLDSILCFGASGLLLASGIMLLRNSAASRWMHLTYAGGKLVLVVLSCYALFSVAAELAADSPGGRTTAMAWMLIVAAPGAVYPIVLLIVMNLRSVKEFLGAPTVGRIF